MFCTNCGNQLPEGTRFCVFCGTAQENEPAAEPVAEPVEAPAPVEETPVIPVEAEVQAPAQETLSEESFLNAVTTQEATYEAPTFAVPEFTAPIPAPKKKKKTGVIIAVVLVLVLLAGAAVGVYFWLDYKNATAYDDAVAMLEAGDISGALDAFEDLGDYEDAADMVEDLETYQQAMKKLEAHEYDEAKELFKKLGKFHDSKTYVQYGVDYHEATYLMESAKKEDSLDLYYSAAEIFEGLGDYQDSAKHCSSCLLAAGLKELERGDNQAAIDLLEEEALNDEDAATLQAAVESSAADATVLVDMELALEIWLDEEDNYTAEEEIQKANEHMARYEGLFFLDASLEDYYYDFMDALETQMAAIESDDDVKDWVMMYQGMADLYKVCENLYDEYGFLKGSDLEDSIIGAYDIAVQYVTIEDSLTKQLVGVEAVQDEEKGYYYAAYTNDTGIDFTLTVAIAFYKDGEFVENGDSMDIEVPAGAEVQIPLIPKTEKIENLNGWKATWYFDLK